MTITLGNPLVLVAAAGAAFVLLAGVDLYAKLEARKRHNLYYPLIWRGKDRPHKFRVSIPTKRRR